MKDTILKIIDLIDQNITLKELSERMNLPYAELFKYLSMIRKEGYKFDKKYYYNGDVLYSISKKIEESKKNTIITSSLDNELEFVIIADLHFGSIYEDSSLIHIIYNYCIKHDIHYLINLGDLIEGVVNSNNIKIPWEKQINHALRVYPVSSEIFSFLLLGNHDFSLLQNYGQDIMKIIEDRREDIIPLGYGEGFINLKNDMLVLQHPLLCKEYKKGIYNKCVILRGHVHEAKVAMDNSNLIIYPPSLSNLNFNRSVFPGAVHIKLKMRSGKIEYVELEELTIIHKKIEITSVMNIFFGGHKSYKNGGIIANEEDYKVLKKL